MPIQDALPLLGIIIIITGFLCWGVDVIDRKSNKHVVVK